MKRLIALFAALLLTGTAFADSIAPRIGLDFGSSQHMSFSGLVSTSKDYDTDPGLTIGADYLHPLSDKVTIGGGFEYQLPRTIKFTNVSNGSFNFIPIYATALFSFKRFERHDILPYTRLNLGFDLLMGDSNYKQSGDLSGGFYWAIGIGAMRKSWLAELNYSTCVGQIKSSRETADITYRKLAVNVGYKFDLNMK